MNNEEQDKCLEGLQSDMKEIKDALLGTYKEKGFITRLRGVEKVIKVLGGGMVFVLGTVATAIIRGWMGV